MRNIIIGILAHVDAGKTSLSEGLLFLSGKIGKLGRVDNRDAYLDTFELERARGITIFSKQAMFDLGDTRITLLDTPGHVDFSAEMERTLQVLDYAILVISGSDGIQGHTRTLWHLFEKHSLPVFVFVNKMDQAGTERDSLFRELTRHLSEGCVDFTEENSTPFFEHLALCDETLLAAYLEEGRISRSHIQNAIRTRKVIPCHFGSALKLEGLESFLKGLATYTTPSLYSGIFGAKVYKITRDDQGVRWTHLKMTGGSLQIRDSVKTPYWDEKVTQIRLYSGIKYETVTEVTAGQICAVAGLSLTRPGEGLGTESLSSPPTLEPVLSYRLLLPEGDDPRLLLPKLRLLEEEEPALHIEWDEKFQEIHVKLMGEVQKEILQSLIKSRFQVVVDFDDGRIVYKETVTRRAEGVGHFEPLRHYAEVHLLLEPGETGSGLKFATDCSEDILGRSWQRLVMTHLEEKSHIGVLTGSAITDMKLTLVTGKAHNKHTVGGDFREATYRAVRQGLMEAESVLLEPWYAFTLEVPDTVIGRAMSDVDMMHGTCEIMETHAGMTLLSGTAPVAGMKNYQQTVVTYTKGQGRLFCSLSGYAPCHNAEEVIAQIGYAPERDQINPTDSVFCAHGASFHVPWDEVKSYMHLESWLIPSAENPGDRPIRTVPSRLTSISQEEIARILDNAHAANQGKRTVWIKKPKPVEPLSEPAAPPRKPKETDEEYLLVDGYNIIHDWPELKMLADDSMDAARLRLLDRLSNYQGIRHNHIIAVFDAYRVVGRREELSDYHNIHVVFTKEAQTADQYIERFAHLHKHRYHITVATSDGLQQMIVRSAGSALLSARELKVEIDGVEAQLQAEAQALQDADKTRLHESLSPETAGQMQQLASDTRASESNTQATKGPGQDKKTNGQD